jgi:Ca2+-binding RTX toxin-like protein
MVATTVKATATIGGAGQNISLNLDANDVSSYYSSALTNGLVSDPPFSVSVNYQYPYAVISASTVVQGTEFQPLVIGSGTQGVTVTGGDMSSTTSQIVIVSSGGLNFTTSGNSNEELFIISGNSYVSFAANTGAEAAYLSSGSNTIIGGSGPTTISAGTGANSIFAGSSSTLILAQGQDSIQLAGGTSTIFVDSLFSTSDNASALVYGDTDPTVKSSIFFDAEGNSASTVFGGTSGSDTFVAGAGGGYFQAGSGGGSQLYAGTGAVTLVGSQSGGDLLDGAGGTNVTILTLPTETTGDLVSTGTGNSTVLLLGKADTVNVGSGQTTVGVAAGTSVNGGSGSLIFIGGSAASTVIGGTGSETIFGGAGGGYFTGGTAGGNLFFAGSGAATIVGAGSGDTLLGGSASDQLTAGSGNETLVAGSGADTMTGYSTGKDVFSFVNEAAHQSYTINAFYVTNSPASDALLFKNAADEAAALASYTVSGGSSVMTLQDGTKITLEGYTGGITGHTGHL